MITSVKKQQMQAVYMATSVAIGNKDGQICRFQRITQKRFGKYDQADK